MNTETWVEVKTPGFSIAMKCTQAEVDQVLAAVLPIFVAVQDKKPEAAYPAHTVEEITP